MKIIELFNRYNQEIQNSTNVLESFDKSEMTNISAKLKFGFFPLGSGIFSEQSEIEKAEIKKCEIMVLGNDFGTIKYLNKKCINEKEEKTNPTISNLLQLEMDESTTFYTNLFLGLRKGEVMVGIKKLETEYLNFCMNFFRIQLELIKPNIVICLGNEVKKAIVKYSNDFSAISKRTMTELYADENKNDFIIIVNGIKFIFIPHPSYAHINWKKNNIKERIRETLKNASR
jgi:uracil-DNA glycosylase